MQPKYMIEPVKIPKRTGIGLLAGLLGLVAGCTEPPPPPPPAKPFQDVTVRVALPQVQIVRDLMARHGQTWAERSGGRVELVSTGSAADIQVFAPAEMGRWAANGELAPLSLGSQRGEGSFEYNRLLHYEVERFMDWGGRAFALPILGESVLCVYRDDLFRDPRHSAALEQRFLETFRHSVGRGGPSTWQEFAAIAEYFASQPGWGADGHKSLPPLPSSPDEFDRDFHLIASPFARLAVNQEKSASLSAQLKSNLMFSYELDVDTGEPLIDRPGFVEALTFMQKLQACRPPGTSPRPLEAFRAGHAVMAIATLADLPWLQDAQSPVRDRFAVCRIPGSKMVFDVAANRMVPHGGSDGNVVPHHGHGGWMAGLTARAVHAEAATDLLVFLSSPPVSQEIVCETAWGGGPTRASHLDNRSAWFNYGLSPAHTSQLMSALDAYYRPTLLNPTYRLRLPDQDEYMKAFAKRIVPALTQDQSAEAALKSVAADWRELARRKDKAAFLHHYRMSQGLR